MKKTMFVICLLLLALLAGCELLTPDDDDDPELWITNEAYDFPIYVGYFDDYLHTDEHGNQLGYQAYGGNGDGNDWVRFDYAGKGGAPGPLEDVIERINKPGGKGAKGSLNLTAHAFGSNAAIAAEIWKDNIFTGHTTPYTFLGVNLAGTYSVRADGYDIWTPPSVTIEDDSGDQSIDFVGSASEPAVLSYFMGSLAYPAGIRISWGTQAEYTIQGFRLHCGDNSYLESAELITPELIPSTNTSSQQSYYYIDENVSTGHTYYYWLEVVSWGDSQYHGPVSVLVDTANGWAELSSFTATLNGQNDVQISWTSQTETLMIGYRVYRNTTAEQNSAQLIDYPMIAATNTNQTHSYTIVDDEVDYCSTYYYWLEAVAYGSSTFHGPVSVTVTGSVPPVLPEVSLLRYAYPNPCLKGFSFNIQIAVKAGGVLRILLLDQQYNILRDYTVQQGSHLLSISTADLEPGLYRVFGWIPGVGNTAQYIYGDVLVE